MPLLQLCMASLVKEPNRVCGNFKRGEGFAGTTDYIHNTKAVGVHQERAI